MSILARFRKPGGVDNLVALLESCMPKKRERLLAVIDEEDKKFGNKVKARILTADKIFKWDPLLINEVTSRMKPRTIAVCVKGLGEKAFEIACLTMSPVQKREIKEILETINPNSAEIESAYIMLVEETRKAETEGLLFIPIVEIEEPDEVPLFQETPVKQAA